MLAGMVGEAVVVFIGLMLAFLVWIDVFLCRKKISELERQAEDEQFAMDSVTTALKEAYVAAFIEDKKAPEFVILPTKPVYDLLGDAAAVYLMSLVVKYEGVYGGINIDKDGNRFEVVVRGKDGKFIPS